MRRRWIMHLDMDAFFASVEQVRNPALAGKSVIVGSGVIASCSYEARKFGLHAGQSLGEAVRLCPQAIILAGDHHVYSAFAEQVWEICGEFTPDMETLVDDAYLDFSGMGRLHGSWEAMARRLKARIHAETGLVATVGLSTSRTVSRIASACGKPNGLRIVPPGSEEAFMRDLPVRKLPGVGPVAQDVLRKMNIHTIGGLGGLPARTLEMLFGANGLAMFERAHGRDSRVVHAREIPQSISRETTFHRETGDRGEIEGMLYYLAERGMNALRDLGLTTGTVMVKMRYSDFAGEAASRTLSRQTDLDVEVYEAAREMLRRIYTRRANLRSVGVKLSGFRLAERNQPGLFVEHDRERLRRLYRALDEVRHRYGYGSIVAGRSLELLERMSRDDYGFVLRTPSLTK